MRWFLLVVCLATALRAAPATLADLRSEPDNRPLIRASLGVRAVRALSATRVEVVIGASNNDVAGQADAWRVVSEADAAYAYASFVRPSQAAVRREVELAPWTRLLVTLDLPTAMKPGADYAFIGQGSGDQVLTGARTAARLLYGREPESADPRLDQAVLAIRAVRPVGGRLVEIEVGPALRAEAANRLDLYRVTVADQPARVEAMGRWSGLDTYRPVGWPFEAIVQHRLWLRLDRDYAPGARVEVELLPALCGGEAEARRAGFVFDDKRTPSPSLKASQVGYLPDHGAKIGYLGRWLGSYPEAAPQPRAAAPGGSLAEQFGALLRSAELATSRREAPAEEPAAATQTVGADSALWLPEPPRFSLLDAGTRREVLSGQARLVHRAGEMNEGYYHHDHSGENVWQLDFTAFRTPGQYVLSVPGVGCSLPFAIGADVFRRPLAIAAAGLAAQRCGCELGPPSSEWRRIACHRAGLTPTTQLRGEPHDIHDLSRKVDYERGRNAPPDPALTALDSDSALVAWYRLEGDFADSSGRGPTLRPRREGQPFSTDTMLLPGANRCFGPTGADAPLGAEADLACDAAAGYTLAGWIRHQGGINFSGTVFGFPGNSGQPRLCVQAGWGVLRVIVGQGVELSLGRVEDGRWHHVAVTVDADRAVRAYLDGRQAAQGTAQAPIGGQRFQLGALEGKELAGKHLDEVRCYRRALTAAEVATLGTRWVERAGRIDAYGGHHDAGDYNPRSHLDVAQTLMDAYEMAPQAFAHGDGLPAILDEADWALRLWRGLQDADGGVFGGTESDGDPNFLQTVELDKLGDYAYAKDPAASLSLAGALAQWSRLMTRLGRDGSADLERARRAYDWALAREPRQGSPRAYADGFLSPLAYAAAELLNTTGEPRYAAAFARAAVWAQRAEADPAVYGLYDQARAALAYCRVPSARADAALQTACRASLLRWADWFLSASETMAYGFVRHPQAPITWGTGANLHYAQPVLWAWWLSGQPRYLDWVLRSCDNLFGANPLGLCYMTGVGARGVHAPLHNSRYRPAGEVIDGLLVNGPNARAEGYRLTDVTWPRPRADYASLHTFADCHFAIAMDEGLVCNQAEVVGVLGLLDGLARGQIRPATAGVK